jgi:hypothetical protein
MTVATTGNESCYLADIEYNLENQYRNEKGKKKSEIDLEVI